MQMKIRNSSSCVPIMPRSLNYRQIEAFRAVMLTGTTIAAAERLNTTQPSISRLLTQIQSTTKLKLFELDRGRLRPTPEATKVFEAVQRSFVVSKRGSRSLIKRTGTGIPYRLRRRWGSKVLPHAITQLEEISRRLFRPGTLIAVHPARAF